MNKFPPSRPEGDVDCSGAAHIYRRHSCLLGSSFGPLKKLQGETYLACRSYCRGCVACVASGKGPGGYVRPVSANDRGESSAGQTRDTYGGLPSRRHQCCRAAPAMLFDRFGIRHRLPQHRGADDAGGIRVRPDDRGLDWSRVVWRISAKQPQWQRMPSSLSRLERNACCKRHDGSS
jgi:hypothetical protein